jgi:hypothetical protein
MKKMAMLLCTLSLFVATALASSHEYDTCKGKDPCTGKCKYSDSIPDTFHNGNCSDTGHFGCTCVS